MEEQTTYEPTVLTDINLADRDTKISKSIHFFEKMLWKTSVFQSAFTDKTKLEQECKSQWNTVQMRLIKTILKKKDEFTNSMIYIADNLNNYINKTSPHPSEGIASLREYICNTAKKKT